MVTMNSFSFSYKPLLLLILLGIIWGAGYSLVRYATTHGVPPLGYAVWQSLGPAVILTLLESVRQGGWRQYCQHWRFFVVLGGLGIALPNTIIYFSAAHLPSSVVAVLVNTVPIFTFLLALLARTERFSWPRCLAVILCVAGLLGLLGVPSILPKSNWVFIALIAPLCFAFAAVFTARFRPPGMRSQQLALGMLWVAWLGVFPLALLTHQFYWPQSSWHMRDVVIMIEMLLSSLGYVVFFSFVKSRRCSVL